jgi:hypothetical protein
VVGRWSRDSARRGTVVKSRSRRGGEVKVPARRRIRSRHDSMVEGAGARRAVGVRWEEGKGRKMI